MKVLHNIGQLVTLEGGVRRGESMRNLGIIENAAVVFNDRIVDYGDSDEILKEYRDAEKIDAKGRVVMPGFVDPHTHAIFAGSRENELQMKIEGKSYMEILKSGGGILYTVRMTRKAREDELFRQTEKRLNTMLLHGTTTVEIKTGYGLDAKTEMKMLNVIDELSRKHVMDIVPTFLGAHAVSIGKKPMEVVDEMISIIPEAAKKAKYIDVFCEKGVFNVEESRVYLEEGKKHGMIPKIHADEIAYIGCTSLALEIGAISVDHLVKTPDDVIEKLGRSNIACVFLPGTPFVLMSNEYPRARKFIESNAIVALATDLNPNCYTENMQIIITLAMLNMKMSVEECISASTINAAYAIGMEKEVGSIEKGKKADMIILDAKNYKQLGYHYGVNLVDTVIKNGEIVVSHGTLVK